MGAQNEREGETDSDSAERTTRIESHERALVVCTECEQWHNARKTNDGTFVLQLIPACPCGNNEFRPVSSLRTS